MHTISGTNEGRFVPAEANPSVAVLVPCHNEELTVAGVVEAFANALPAAAVYVYDNRSTDRTAEIAVAAGATVRSEPRPGKGSVVRRMFADVEADVYVLVDGDGTYDAAAAPHMVELVTSGFVDMVVASRAGIYENAHRTGHGLGNRVFNAFYKAVFGPEFSDIFSGYRAFSRRFVKSFPAVSRGFEIETEMSVHASQLRLPVAEIEVAYRQRPEGSVSKLNTLRDAARILRMMLILYKEVRPARFFGSIAAAFFGASLLLGVPLLETFLETGLVPRFPTAILATGLAVLSAIALTCGLILDSVARGRLEQKRFAYLDQGASAAATSARAHHRANTRYR